MRINLYNYRQQEQRFRKLRIWLMVTVGVFLALLANLLIYSYFQVKILYQQTRNSFLSTSIEITNNRLKPINDFNLRVNILHKKLSLINMVENKRDDEVAFFQQLSKIIPEQVYFSQITFSGQSVSFSGVASSPLYIADFIDRLRDPNGAFIAPVLRSNTTSDNNHYNFNITANVESNLVAESTNGNE
jgi:type IV pilus assembly protein PilN